MVVGMTRPTGEIDSLGDNVASIDVRLVSSPRILRNAVEIDEQLDAAVADIMNRIENFIANGSDWAVDAIKTCTVQTAPYDAIAGSSYVATPADIVKRKVAGVIRDMQT